MKDFNNKRVLVLGAGRDGVAAAQFIYHTYPNARLAVADKRSVEMPLEQIKTLFGNDYPTSLSDWDVVVVSPGVPPREPLLKTAKAITTGTNIFLEHCKGTVIGVTGSKGKSTTSALIASVLKHAGKKVHLVGNIGTPALTELREHNTAEDIYVYEMSSYMTRLLEKAPDIAVVTELFPEHQDYHGSTEQYFTDKLRIAALLTPKQHLVYNDTNTELAQRVANVAAQKHPYPSQAEAHTQNTELAYADRNILFINEIPLDGYHNVLNTMAAVNTAAILGIEPTAMEPGITQFVSLPHRLQFVGTFQEIDFYNDSLSTAPEATLAALQAVSNVKTLFLGGQDRGYDYTHLAEEVVRLQVEHVVLFPDSGPTIRKKLEAAGYTGDFLESADMAEAVKWAYEVTPKGSVCMLSCAAPSYSIFIDYQDRGNRFTGAVITLGHGHEITYESHDGHC